MGRRRSPSSISALAACAAVVLATAAAPAKADLGLQFDVTTLTFSYEREAGPEGRVGHLSITDDASSSLTLRAVNLGLDGRFDGFDDQVVDVARINSAAQFSAVLAADVYHLGPADYRIVGTFGIADTTGATVVLGDLVSTNVGTGGGVFHFEGELRNDDGLLRGTGDDWLFQGLALDTRDDILGVGDFGLDGVDGTVRLNEGWENYKGGSLVDFHFTGYFGDLDGFFLDGDRGGANGDLKVRVVPAPGAGLLCAMGLSMVGWCKRRSR